MNKRHSFAFYALVAPAITLGAGTVLAEQSTGQNADRERQSAQQEQDAKQHSAPKASKDEQSKRGAGQPDSLSAADRRDTHGESRMQNRGYLDSAPAKGMQASNLIGTEVKTTGDESVGLVDDLIIDKNGQVVAIVVGVGGFLGMGERNIAIGWDDVTKSGASDEQALRINATREDLRSAPEFKSKD